MRNFLLLVSMFSFVLPAKAYDMQGLMDAFYSVVMIRGYNANGGLAYGSGVVVGDNKVITNCHVLRATKQPWVSRVKTLTPLPALRQTHGMTSVWSQPTLCRLNRLSLVAVQNLNVVRK